MAAFEQRLQTPRTRSRVLMNFVFGPPFAVDVAATKPAATADA
jgi:hypothetical protein